jgi:hypothetical protein
MYVPYIYRLRIFVILVLGHFCSGSLIIRLDRGQILTVLQMYNMQIEHSTSLRVYEIETIISSLSPLDLEVELWCNQEAGVCLR